MIFQATIRATLRFVLLAAPFLFVFSLPWVDLGIWRQTETATVVLHALSAAAALLLAALVATGNRRARAAAMHPVPLAFAAVAGLTLVQVLLRSPETFDAPRAIHGLIKHGVGGLWHLDVAMLAAGYLATGSRRWRSLYAGSALAALTVAAALTFLFIGKGDNPWVPYDFTGWLGVFAVLAAAAGFAAPDRRLRYAAVALGVFGLYVGRNSTADAAAAVAAAGYLFWRFRPVGTETIRRTGLAAAGLALVGFAVALPLSTGPIEAFATRSVTAETMKNDGIPSTAPVDHVEVAHGPFGTVWSRGWMARTVIANLIAHPASLAYGRGWGSFPQVYSEEMRSVPGRAFTAPSETSSKTFWDPHRKADFHSHNLMLETLLSLGLPGVLVMAFAFMSPLVFARRRDVPAAAFLTLAFCIVGGMWFVVNTLAPVLALAFAACSRPMRQVRASRPARPWTVRIGTAAALAASGLAMFFASGIMFGVSVAGREARFHRPMDWTVAPPCKAIAGLTAPAREINVSTFRRFVEAGEASPVAFAWFAQRNKTAVNYACILRDLSDHATDPSLLEASLDLRFRVLRASDNFPLILQAMKVDISYWGDDIRRLLSMAPDRTDVIVPYVTWLVSKGDKQAAQEAIAKLAPLVMPDDPVADWLDARRAELAGDEATYRTRMAAALRGGIANLIPLRRADTEIFMDDGAKPAAKPDVRSDAAPATGTVR